MYVARFCDSLVFQFAISFRVASLSRKSEAPCEKKNHNIYFTEYILRMPRHRFVPMIPVLTRLRNLATTFILLMRHNQDQPDPYAVVNRGLRAHMFVTWDKVTHSQRNPGRFHRNINRCYRSPTRCCRHFVQQAHKFVTETTIVLIWRTTNQHFKLYQKVL